MEIRRVSSRPTSWPEWAGASRRGGPIRTHSAAASDGGRLGARGRVIRSDARIDLCIEAKGHEHLDPFVDLLEDLGAWLWSQGIEQWAPGSNRAQRPLFERFLNEGVLAMACDRGRIAGGCIVTREPTAEWAERPGAAGYLHKLAVARSFAGRGLGAELLDWAERWTRSQGLAALRLDCWDGNEALRGYYREAGFDELEAVESHGYLVRLFDKSVGPEPVRG